MITRTGKIARLPKPIREQLNHRLENGELGTSLVTWLNQLPEAQKIITEHFDGKPIRPQNLSEWRQGGYIDWIRHQLLREQTRLTAEQSAELGLDTSGNSISIAEDTATIMSAELAIHVHALGEIKSSKQRFRQFCLLSRELSRFRRDDQRALRTQLRHGAPLHLATQHSGTGVPPVRPEPPVGRDSVEPKLPPSASKSESAILDPHPPGAPKPSDGGSPLPSAGGASSLSAEALCEGGSLASRARPATNAEQPSEPALFAGAPTKRASIPDCGSPLPLSDNSSTLKLLNSQTPQSPLPLSETSPIPNSQTPPSDPRPATLAPSSPSAPIRVNPHRNYYDPRPPIRGRRFVCIEG